MDRLSPMRPIPLRRLALICAAALAVCFVAPVATPQAKPAPTQQPVVKALMESSSSSTKVHSAFGSELCRAMRWPSSFT